MIQLSCLGPPSVKVAGEDPPPELLWRKHLALLIYLAHSPKGRSRDHLVGLLWPDKEEAKARHSLNEALRVIRKVAGDSLLTESDAVRLHPDVVEIDGETLGASGSVFLEGFSVSDAPEFEDWVSRERQKRLRLDLDLLVGQAEKSLNVGDLVEAKSRARRALELEDKHEPAARALMRAHALSGARALAIQVYEQLSQRLHTELSLDPDSDTAELAERIRTARITRGQPASEVQAAEPVPLFGPGRDALAAALREWRGTRSGRPGTIVLRGDPGTGKTRVLDELAARARLDGVAVAEVRALKSDGPDDLWSALLRGGLAVAEIGGAPAESIAALAAFEPDLFLRYPAAREAQPVGPDAALIQSVGAIAEVRPVLLIVDDAHLLHDSVIDVLARVIERVGRVPVCAAIATAKRGSESIDALSERIGRDLDGAVVRTEGFGERDMDELVTWAFPEYDEASAERLRRRVIADTRGNPFLAVELVRAVHEGLRVGEEGGDIRWPAESRTLDETMPGDLSESVSAALRLRFRSLTEAAQAMLVVVAVLGGTDPIPVLATAGELDQKRAEDALDELEWERWLVGDSRGYEFTTRLAREVVLADMVTGGQKRRIEKRAAKAR